MYRCKLSGKVLPANPPGFGSLPNPQAPWKISIPGSSACTRCDQSLGAISLPSTNLTSNPTSFQDLMNVSANVWSKSWPTLRIAKLNVSLLPFLSSLKPSPSLSLRPASSKSFFAFSTFLVYFSPSAL